MQRNYRPHRNASTDRTAGIPGADACGVMRPGCGEALARACDVSMVSGVLYSLATASGDQLTMAPERTDYFQPLSEKIEVIDASSPTTNRRASVQRISINNTDQEPFSSGTLSAANTAAALSDFFGPAFDGFGKPVGYGIYTQRNLTGKFEYSFWNLEPVAISIWAVHFGNPLSVLPPGATIGVPA